MLQSPSQKELAAHADSNAPPQNWGDRVFELAALLDDPPSSTEGVENLGTGSTSYDVADDEWTDFPRTKWNVAETCLGRPNTITSAVLFRHVSLNPRDVYIPREARRRLTIWVEAARAHFAAGVQVLAAATSRDLRAQIESGALEPLTLRDDVGVRQYVAKELERVRKARKKWAERGIPYVEPRLGQNWTSGSKLAYEGGQHIQSFLVEGASFYGIRRDQAPTAGPLWLERDALAASYAQRIVQWFVDQGLLDTSEAATIFAELSESLGEPLAPR